MSERQLVERELARPPAPDRPPKRHRRRAAPLLHAPGEAGIAALRRGRDILSPIDDNRIAVGDREKTPDAQDPGPEPRRRSPPLAPGMFCGPAAEEERRENAHCDG